MNIHLALTLKFLLLFQDYSIKNLLITRVKSVQIISNVLANIRDSGNFQKKLSCSDRRRYRVNPS